MERKVVADEPAETRKTNREPDVTTSEKTFTVLVDGWTRQPDKDDETNVWVRFSHAEPPDDFREGWDVMADNVSATGLRQLGEWLIEFAKHAED